MGKKKETQKVLQVKISEEALEQLTEMKLIMRADSIASVIHQSITLYKWCLEEKLKGSKIISKRANGSYRELICKGDLK